MLYPVAVSLYSTALVCWPGLLHGHEQAWKKAAWVFAVAGWVGSGLGIGMAENLAHVPLWFLISAALVVGGVLSRCKISLMVICAIGMIAVTGKTTVEESEDIERGRRVYMAEGCINCHSKYLRAGGIDEAYWGVMKSEPLKEKNGTPASPAIARAKRVLPVPGDPINKQPRGILAPTSVYFLGFFRKSTISVSSCLASSIPATSAKVALFLFS
jgi:hypothetical protein